MRLAVRWLTSDHSEEQIEIVITAEKEDWETDLMKKDKNNNIC